MATPPRSWLCALGAGAWCLAHGQPTLAPGAAPPDPVLEQRRALERGDAQRQRAEQQQHERERDAERLLARPPAGATDPALLPTQERPCAAIERIAFAGVDGAPAPAALLHGLEQALAQVQAQAPGPAPDATDTATDPPLGRCLGAQGVRVLLQRAQNHLLQRGYLTSRVLAAAQDLSGGTLTLTLVAGHVGAIRAQPVPGAWRSASTAGLIAAFPTAPGQLLQLRDVEQGLDNLVRVPTSEARIEITPAASVPPGAPAFGYSDIVVHYQQHRPLRLAASLNNSGTRATGTRQGAITLQLDNPLTLNDLASLTWAHDLGGGQPLSAGQRGTSARSASYSLPWGHWTLGGAWSASRYHQSVAGLTQSYLYRGESALAELTVQRVLQRGARSKTSAGLTLWSRSSRNHIDDTEVEVQRRRTGGWGAQLRHRHYLGQASADIELAWRRGTGAFAARPAPEQAFGEGSARFALWTLAATLDLPFSLGAQRLRYSGAWRLQQQRTPLTPIERFAIGGMYSVRGFDGEATLLGGRGWLLRNDLALALGESGQHAYLGLDAGHVGGSGAQSLAGRSLVGTAIGLRGSGARWASGLSYDVFIGLPLHRPAGFGSARRHLGASLYWQF